MKSMVWARLTVGAAMVALAASACVITTGDPDDDRNAFEDDTTPDDFSDDDDVTPPADDDDVTPPADDDDVTPPADDDDVTPPADDTTPDDTTPDDTTPDDDTPPVQTAAITRQTEIDETCMACLTGESDISHPTVTAAWEACDGSFTCGEEAARFMQCVGNSTVDVPDCPIGEYLGCCQDKVVADMHELYGEDYVYTEEPSEDFLDFLDTAVPQTVFADDGTTIADDSPPSCDLDCI